MNIRISHFFTIFVLILILCIKSSAIDKTSPNYGITHKTIFNNPDNCTLCHLYNNFSSDMSDSMGQADISLVSSEDVYDYEEEDGGISGGLGWFLGSRRKAADSIVLESYVSRSFELGGFINGDNIIAHEFSKSISSMCMSPECHTKMELGYSHEIDISPFDRYPNMNVPKEMPLNWDTEKYEEIITCGTCHNPHLDWLSAIKSYRVQKSFKKLSGKKYYKTYYLRIKDPERGYVTLCKGCHEEK